MTPARHFAGAARSLGIAALALTASVAAQAHDYPTADRVRFVQECMRDHPGPHFEMTNKCVCAIDKIAEQMPHDVFVAGSTVANANSLGGERGNAIRDVAILQDEVKLFRAAVNKAKSGCFINLPLPR
jgi:hypothetical protein